MTCVIGVSTSDERGAEECEVAVQGSGVLGAVGRKGVLALHVAGAVSSSEKVCDEAQQLHCEVKRRSSKGWFVCSFFWGFLPRMLVYWRVDLVEAYANDML